jgi:hypothetical protein
MLLAYHKDTLSAESTAMFHNIRSSASIARRSFRLLKSLNHFANILDTVKFLLSTDCKNKMDLLFSMSYEASLASLYYFDNYVFLSRLGIFSHTAEENDTIYKKSVISWCVGECLKLASLMFKHKSQQKELNVLRAERSRVQSLSLDKDSSRGIEMFLCEEIQRLERERKELTFQYVKVKVHVMLALLLFFINYILVSLVQH